MFQKPPPQWPLSPHTPQKKKEWGSLVVSLQSKPKKAPNWVPSKQPAPNNSATRPPSSARAPASERRSRRAASRALGRNSPRQRQIATSSSCSSATDSTATSNSTAGPSSHPSGGLGSSTEEVSHNVKPGVEMVYPPCKELRRRPQLFLAGPLTNLHLPGFDCSSNVDRPLGGLRGKTFKGDSVAPNTTGSMETLTPKV